MRFDVEDWLDNTIGITDRATSQDGHPELICECPQCGGANKLWANATTGKWICYSCRESGGLPGLIAVVEGITYREAKQHIADSTRTAVSRSVKEIRSRLENLDVRATPSKPPPLELPDHFVPVFDRKAWCWNTPTYLKRRGIKPKTAMVYRLGYCTGGRYGGRLILPAHEFGRLSYFQGRTMGADRIKYLSPAVAGAGSTLYGLDEAIGSPKVVVVEGPLDVLSLHQRGYIAIALFGKQMSSTQKMKIKRCGFRDVTILLDGDAIKWGARAAESLARIGIRATLAKLPPEHDPDSAPADVVHTAIRGAAPPTLRDRIIGH
jgi:DNA primase